MLWLEHSARIGLWLGRTGLYAWLLPGIASGLICWVNILRGLPWVNVKPSLAKRRSRFTNWSQDGIGDESTSNEQPRKCGGRRCSGDNARSGRDVTACKDGRALRYRSKYLSRKERDG